MTNQNILVLGIGNYLLGDEGVGCHAIQYMEEMGLPQEVTLLDGGTGGFHLLGHLDDFERIILIDASLDEYPEGHIRVIHPRFPKDFPQSLSAHEIGLRDLVEALFLLERSPEIHLIAVSVKDLNTVKVGLSKELEKSLSRISEFVWDILNQWKLAKKPLVAAPR